MDKTISIYFDAVRFFAAVCVVLNSSFDNERVTDIAGLTVLVVLCTWGIGELTEKRKHLFKKIFDQIANELNRRFFSKKGVAAMIMPNRNFEKPT